LPSRKVRAIYQGEDSTLWFGTTQGLCAYKNNKIQKVYSTQDGLKHNYIRAISQTNNGEIVVGTNTGISIQKGERFETLKRNTDTIFDLKIRTLYKDSNGKIWVGTEDGIYYIKDKKVIPYLYNVNLPSLRVLSFLTDSKGFLWVGTQQGLVKIKDNKIITTYNDSTGLISNRVRAICEDKLGGLWIGTRTGVSHFYNDRFTNISTKNGLSHERIRDILLDNNGTLWFATYYGGINNFNPKDFVTYTTTEHLASNQILSLTEWKDSVVVAGTFDGLSVLKFKDKTLDTAYNYNILNGLPHNRIYSVYKDSHKYLWVGTKKGIGITKDFNHYTKITNVEGLSGKEVFSILEENSHIYWVGTDNGLNKINFSRYPTEYTITQHDGDDKNAMDVSAIVKDLRGNVWIGYRHYGIRVKRKNGSIIKPTFSHKIENITTIVVQNNKIWIGTDASGLFLIDNLEFSNIIPVKNYTTKDGLSSNNIYAVALENNSVWCGSEKGVDKISFDAENKVLNVESFGSDEGVIGGEIIEKSILQRKNDMLLLGTVNGLATSSPINYPVASKAPILNLLFFEAFSSDKEERENLTHSIQKEIVLHYAKNNISLEYIGIDLNAPKKVKYKWFLKGYSNSWSAPTHRTFLNFTNLSPKNYELKIISSNRDGVWNEKPLIIRFKIQPPFWMTTWFLLLALLVLVGIVFIAVKWKINQLIKTQEMLERKIQKATKVIEEEKKRIEEQSLQIYSQKEKLEEQHKEIKQSIDYAQLIQEASLPEKNITDYIPQSFLLFQPRDIVSGDFYWWEKKDDLILFCVADSTGHGIPGAFISLIGTILYNEIFYSRGVIYPNNILDELNHSLQITLEQHLPNPKIKDGMDLAFCCLDKKTNILYFSGANNPVWIVRHNDKKLQYFDTELLPNFVNEKTGSVLFEIKGDKQPIGLHAKKQEPFTLHQIQLEKGDEIYLSTDGYADQFGGEKNKKFMSKRFKRLLTANGNEPMDKIRTLLELNFATWKGKNEQVDDVCVVGVRI